MCMMVNIEDVKCEVIGLLWLDIIVLLGLVLFVNGVILILVVVVFNVYGY